jgi:hypothetical protein
MGIPGMPDLRFDVRKPGAGRGIGDSDQVMARRALDLATSVARIALQGLITVGAVEFEFIGGHSLHSFMRKAGAKVCWIAIHTCNSGANFHRMATSA